MGKTRGVHETTPELRNRMVGMYEAGLGLREIAAAVNCSQRTVKRWLNRFDKEGTVETRERCGRKRATTTEQDAAIIRLATQTPITAAKAVLPALGLTCSVDTIRERLHKAGIHNWSPSRKHIQKIPLGDADGAAIQQAVWRPTGTLLGKKKSQKFDDSTNKSGAVMKKKILRRKIKSKNNDIDTESSTEVSKQQQSEQTQQLQQDQLNSSFNFQPDNLNQAQQPSQSDENTQMQRSSLMSSQPEFSNALSLVVSSQSIYQHHPGVDVTQNWPLDLGQSSHHYPQSQTQTMTLHQSSSQQHLQELHTPQEQEQRAAEAQVHDQHMQDHNHSIQQLNHHQEPQHHHHHHPFDQPQHQLEQIQPQLQQLQTREPSKLVRSNSCSNSSNDNSSDNDNDLNKDSSRECDDNYDRSRSRKKKGGKAKGTLETSVEIRNRMIGMSEAGLSTLSIALAINRSERTVKRWLERWNKEGNVQTKERKGRRRITTKEQDAAIVAMATQNPLTAAKHVAPALGLNCSVDTIRERLHKAGIHSWKLGKKQGEGNAVHTVHLWQPSGNRPNKPKIINNDNNNKKKKTPDKKVNSGSNNVKRSTNNNNNNTNNNKKKKTDEAPKNLTPTSGSIICNTEQNSIQQYHDNSGGITYPSAPSMMQPVHIPQAQSLVPQQPPPPPQLQPVPAPLVSIPPPPSSAIPQATSVPHSMQPLGPIMQRPDCRMISSIPTQNSAIIGYSSCMVGNNNHMDHQPDPLNYEPFIWTF